MATKESYRDRQENELEVLKVSKVLQDFVTLKCIFLQQFSPFLPMTLKICAKKIINGKDSILK